MKDCRCTGAHLDPKIELKKTPWFLMVFFFFFISFLKNNLVKYVNNKIYIYKSFGLIYKKRCWSLKLKAKSALKCFFHSTLLGNILFKKINILFKKQKCSSYTYEFIHYKNFIIRYVIKGFKGPEIQNFRTNIL